MARLVFDYKFEIRNNCYANYRYAMVGKLTIPSFAFSSFKKCAFYA
ncbi:hypothetical protein HMPREF6745_0983 [Prevotella sp. oral taxon 472 str. F0295]|nr:hypothetical protein HMPREF6745_0983 [Prevotella sp. oral taxon 472 str. F0295]